MATQACSTCRGQGLNPYTNHSSVCPMCDGSGKQYDPGRLFLYEMGPFMLNAPAAISPTLPQYFVGAAATGPTLNGVTCQVTDSPFRWMFALAKATFPFAIQPKDAGSGTGRSFCPQQLQVHSQNLFGTAEHPMPLVTPYVFDKNVQITADFTDLAGGVGVCSVTNGSPNVAWVSGALFNTLGSALQPQLQRRGAGAHLERGHDQHRRRELCDLERTWLWGHISGHAGAGCELCRGHERGCAFRGIEHDSRRVPGSRVVRVKNFLKE